MNHYEGLTIFDDNGHPHVTDPVVCELALQIEQAYCALAAKYNATCRTVARKYWPAVYKAALLCQQLDYEPLFFTKIQVDGMLCANSTRNLILPKLLSSEKWIYKSSADAEVLSAEQTNKYAAELELVKCRGALFGVEAVLRDEETPISSLTRVTLAWAHEPRLVGVIAKYVRGARADYMTSHLAQTFFASYDLGFLNVTAIQ